MALLGLPFGLENGDPAYGYLIPNFQPQDQHAKARALYDRFRVSALLADNKGLVDLPRPSLPGRPHPVKDYS